MDSWFDGIVKDAVREAPRRYAQWDDGVFQMVALPAIARMARSCGADGEASRRLMAGYVAAMVEGVGLGYIPAPLGEDEVWPNLLSYLLVRVVPWALPRSTKGDRLQTLAELWNLGEGLLAEPMWVNRYVVARAEGLWELDCLADWLVGVLEPVLTPPPPPSWAGPFGVKRLDLGETDDHFLPGAMHLAAPSLLCVQHREQEDTFVSILLRRGGETSVIGETPDLGRYAQAEGAAEVEAVAGGLRIGAAAVELTHVGVVAELVVASAGFVVVSAEDSQLLWVVESP